MLEGSPGAEIRLLEGVQNQKVGAKTVIRRFKKKTHPTPEYTGFVDFENFIFMCVLFTPEQLEKKNLRKLRFVLREAFPIRIRYDHTQSISEAETQLKELHSVDKRAGLLCQIGLWHREMGRLQDARQSLEESLSLVPNYYEALKQLFSVLIGLGDKSGTLDLMRRMLRLDPHNPTVFHECFVYAGDSSIVGSDLLHLFETLRTDYPDDQLVQANCDFYAGKMLMGTDPSLARKHFVAAKAKFRGVFPPDHYVFAVLRSDLRQLSHVDSSSGER
jgi:tetratricopeptide (TPR) repeat protein